MGTNRYNMAKKQADEAAQNHPQGDHDFVYTPMGCPVGIDLYRKTEPGPRHNPPKVINVGQVGHTLVIDYYTFGVKAYFKHEDDGRLVVFLEDSEGREVVGEYQRDGGR